MTAWISQGPDPILGGFNVGVSGKAQVGALEAVVAHPTNPDIVWVGSVNGGIWKTTNATAANPTWSTTTDALPSLSITSLDVDPANPENLVAGIGRRSSFAQLGGSLSGLLFSNNGGQTWSLIGSPTNGQGFNLQGQSFSGVAIRGDTILAVSRIRPTARGNFFGGIFRSTDGGATFSQLNVVGRVGRVYTDLVTDPTNRERFYAAAINQGAGVFVSEDGGETWEATATLPLIRPTQIVDAEGKVQEVATANIEMAVGKAGQIYVGVINQGLVAVYRSEDQGKTWISMGVPVTIEGTDEVGIHPGGQGNLHFSIAADPTDPNVVYVGGDRQPQGDGGYFPNVPNSIGARSYGGRLFRGTLDASGKTIWTPITDNFADPDGVNGPLPGTSPHPDSRDMTFTANNTLLEVDDGGIYQRTLPLQNTGIWTSLIGTQGNSSGLRITEVHSVDWDSNTKRILGGAQDNGVIAGRVNAQEPWEEVRGGDGGRVAIDDQSGPTSTWYFSSQSLGRFQYREVTQTQISKEVYAALKVQKGKTDETLEDYEGREQPFLTPIKLNAVKPSWLVILGSKGLYESQGERRVTEAGNIRDFILTDAELRLADTSEQEFVINGGAIAYGGRLNGEENPYVLYVGTDVIQYDASKKVRGRFGELYLRTSQKGPLNKLNSFTDSQPIVDIAVDPNNWQNAYVLNNNKLYRTTNAGKTWVDITGDLFASGNLGVGSLQSVEYVAGGQDGLIVGGLGGAFYIEAPNTATDLTWTRLGTDLPNVIVYDLTYDSVDDVLVAGTMGRGVWSLYQVRSVFGGISPPIPSITPDSPGLPNLFVVDAGAYEDVSQQVTVQGPDDEVSQETDQIDEDELLPTLTFLVRLDKPSDVPVTVVVNTRDDTALAGQDYLPIVDQLITFEPGETIQEVRVTLINDTVSEGSRLFFLDLSHATNAVIKDGTGVAEIFNDDEVFADVAMAYNSQTGIFTVEGESFQTVTGTFTLKQSASSFRNEVGFFVVDDQNRVIDPVTGDLVSPTDAGYIQSALGSGQVIFSALPDAVALGFTDLSRRIELNGGDNLVFYLIPNGTTDQVLNGTLSSNAVLLGASLGSGPFRNLRVTDQGNGQYTLGWEDQAGGGDQDFDDVILNFKINDEFLPPEAAGQGIRETELIDLFRVDLNGDRRVDTQVTASFVVNAEAAFNNTVGFYWVDDELGSIGTLAPTDTGYAAAALQQRVLEVDRNGSPPVTLTGDALGLLAPFIVANGTVEQWKALNPTNAVDASIVAYFSFIGANPDHTDHIRLLGQNTYGFEDLPRGGDMDYNDIIAKFTFQGT